MADPRRRDRRAPPGPTPERRRRLIVSLSDPDDPRLRPYRQLGSRGARDPGSFFAESELAVSRLLASGWEVESVLATPPRAERLAAAAGEVPLYAVSKPVLREVVGFDLHRGCVARAPRPAEQASPLAGLAERDRLRIVVAEGLSDPANIGALLRNARAFAADLVLLDPSGGDPLDPRAIRAAVGNTFVVPWRRTPIPAALNRLRAELPGLELLAATVGPRAEPLAARSLNALSPPRRLAVLVGNEGAGLSDELLELADREITIPIDPAADSLNVAAASAILLYALG